MLERSVELAVGDTLLIGDHLLTLIDIDADEVTVRIDEVSPAELTVPSDSEAPGRFRPR